MPFKILLFMNKPVLAGPDVNTRRIFLLSHHPIGAHVDPLGVGIFGDDEMAGAQITAAVFFVQKRRGKIRQVDFITLLNIFVNIAAGHFDSRQRDASALFSRDTCE